MRGPGLRATVVLFGLLLAGAGCGAGAASSAPTTMPPEVGGPAADDQTAPSHFTVGLKVVADDAEAPAGQRIRLAAVVVDADGERVETDLGEYVGNIVQAARDEEELIKVRVVAEGAGHRLRLVQTPTGIEVFRQPLQGDEPVGVEELLHHLRLPDGSLVVPAEEPLEL